MTAKPTPTLYGIPNCDTVKRARAWLHQRGIEHRFHDFKKSGVPPQALNQWLQRVDWTVLINRQGSTWRKLSPEQQAATTDAAAAADLALHQPSVIKRPVVAWPDGHVSVGLDALIAKAG
jgi:arsenate reductase (glutaredoxin)